MALSDSCNVCNAVRKPERPQIYIKSSESQWASFLDEWDTYKRRAGISRPDTSLELRATCSTTLRRSLFDFMGKDTLRSADEEGLLNHIKNIAVKGKNTAVHMQAFYGMAQVAEQPIQAFVGQLRSKAAQCDFTTKCTSSRYRDFWREIPLDTSAWGGQTRPITSQHLLYIGTKIHIPTGQET